MRAWSSGVSFGSRRSGSSDGIADRLGAERVEPRCEVAVGAVRLDESHRGRDAAEELRVGRRGRRRAAGAGSAGGAGAVVVATGCA